MPFKYKIDILAALKANGYSTYRVRKENIFGQATMQQFRTGEIASLGALEKLCNLLECQPGDLLVYEKDCEK